MPLPNIAIIGAVMKVSVIPTTVPASSHGE